WIKSYLTGRKQKVVLNGAFSRLLDILAGVPQGSILGPLLFLIYINDICLDLINVPFLFADDTSLLSIGDSWDEVESSVNRDLTKLSEWSARWKLNFNVKKSEYLMLRCNNKNKLLNLILNDKQLPRVTTHKHLGIVYNDKFNWADHIDFTVRKVSKKLGILYLARNKFNRIVLMKVYYNFILPVLEYGNIIYDGSSVADLLKLDRLHA
ncbi:MAG: reverse transcriptase domain-containing protein, partial [Oscillospiraceae bacterium]